jgi:hypothetical protein
VLATLLGAIPVSNSTGAETLSDPGRQPGELARIQMHSSRLRGIAYLSTLQPGAALGTRFYRARTCTLIWAIPGKMIDNPQHVAFAHMGSPDGPVASLQVTTKLNDGVYGPQVHPFHAYTLSPAGRILSEFGEAASGGFTLEPVPFQNANLDGVPTAEDRLATFGQVVDKYGRLRLAVDWYWNLQTLTLEEKALRDPGEKWTRSPFAFDLNNDGRDELVVWGRRKLVVGTLAPNPAP